jgi:cytochrome P450
MSLVTAEDLHLGPGLAIPRASGSTLLGVARHGMLEYLRRQWLRHGDIFRVSLGAKKVVAVVHPDAIEHVLIENRDVYVKGATYDAIRVLTGQGLLTLEGDAWRKRRRLAQPAFHRERLNQLVAAMVGITGETLSEWRARIGPGVAVDAHAEMMRLTLEIVGATLLGLRFGRATTDGSARAFGDALELLSVRSNSPVALPLGWPTPGNLRLRRALGFVDTMVQDVIRGARAQDSRAAPTLLGMLLDARDQDTGETLTDRELRDEVVTLVLAGHETTALLLSWGFTLLGRHPQIVRRMRAEVDEVLGDRPPSADDLPKLVYTGWVVDEILRLRAPVWAVARDVARDDRINGFAVHAGETVLPLVYLTHRHPGFWDDAEHFDPERFRPERKEGRHRGAYLPFSTGPRICIGNVFTLMEAKILLAMILQQADIELARLLPVPEQPAMTMRPKAPIDIRLRWRRPSRN